ncbi:MAG TPA: Pycsar system effector family protein, partial [Myxococcales bacterium]|nr:Pycsar system effector family protein [Myxococcales bacterium]
NELLFHCFKRSRDVVAACKEIAKQSRLDDDEVRIVLLAAWFHDAAYAVAPDGDRKKSIELARAFLTDRNQPEELIESVATCIASAQAPAQDHPLHEVLHDALLSPLADKDFVPQADLFRLEQERRTGKRFTDVDWTQQCIEFVEHHRYRTRYAHVEYDQRREANLMKLYKLLRKQQEEAAEQKAEEAKAAKGAGKTVESVFYFLTKMTVQVMTLADRRTSTMIHVNAIMISAVVALLLRRIEEQRYLLAPTLVLLAVNLVVIFIAVYSMRFERPAPLRSGPGATVFGFDPRTSMQQYEEGMGMLVADGPTMQKAMIEHLYVIRKMLNRRGQALKITYDVFIFGLALSLGVFAFVLIRR